MFEERRDGDGVVCLRRNGDGVMVCGVFERKMMVCWRRGGREKRWRGYVSCIRPPSHTLTLHYMV